jgi:tetratricopeptide (TPR) repeat protein
MTRASTLLAAFLLAAGLFTALGPAAASPADKAAPLLDQLKTAPSAQQAERLEAQIATVWRAQISPAVQLLVDHALMSMGHQDRATALADLDAALDLQSDQAELWRLHAEARFANGDETGAFADLAQALSRDPRCFPALIDLSHYAEERNDYPRALQAWRKLQRKVSGQPL